MPKYSAKKGYDKSAYSKGSKGAVMKSHGNVSSIETTAAQKFDMGRMQIRPMEYRGYAHQAFDYKY